MTKLKSVLLISFSLNCFFATIQAQQEVKGNRWDISFDFSNNFFNKRFITSIDNNLVSVTQNFEYNYSGSINYLIPNQKKNKIGIGLIFNEYNHSFTALYKNSVFNSNPNFPIVYSNAKTENEIKIQTIGLTFLIEKKIFNSYFLSGRLNIELPISRKFKYEPSNFDMKYYKFSETLPKNSLSFYNFIFPELNLTKYLGSNLAVYFGLKISPFSFQNQYKLVFVQSENVILDYQIKSDLYAIKFGFRYSFFN